MMFAKVSGLFILLLAVTTTLSAKELKVLMIGNSFSRCVGVYLPRLVNAENKHHLILTSAYIGGCPLHKHHAKLLEAEKNPAVKPYKITVWDSKKNPESKTSDSVAGNVNELLKNNQYDIITIQQGSARSFDYNTYQPYADELIKYIRKYQKNAEIVIHQTWAYRVDSPSFKGWKLDQKTMYEKIAAAYRTLAEKHKLRVIPMADAVQIYRTETPKKYVPIDRKATYKFPALPDFSGDVVGVSLWQTNRKVKPPKRYVHNDYSHLNNQGNYLQAACWYAFLFNEDAEKISYTPKSIKAEDAELLRKCAQKAVKNYSQVK